MRFKMYGFVCLRFANMRFQYYCLKWRKTRFKLDRTHRSDVILGELKENYDFSFGNLFFWKYLGVSIKYRYFAWQLRSKGKLPFAAWVKGWVWICVCC